MVKFNTEKFHGTVCLKDQMMLGRSEWSTGVCGLITVMPAEDMVGFKPGKMEANWVARVENQDGSESVNILGCQIRAIHQHAPRSWVSKNTFNVGKD